ncbi:MAG TPA: 30S ribosomal protein S12 methylthiotransferase RimO, partial [Armatimonadota bacterium]|nr:30S ribosomal protein S12 methylthiotransferase RimO [Armatimonadota bacterium]
ILEISELKESGKCKAVVVAGCLGQRFGADLLNELPEVDGVLGPNDTAHVVEVVDAALRGDRPVEVDETGVAEAGAARWTSGTTVSRYVKIAEGCDHACSFCTIPRLRGSYRSRPPDAIVQECRAMVEDGTKEIVFVAQDTTAYGSDLEPMHSLAKVIHSLRTMSFDGWLRFMYMHPDRLEEELITAIGEHMTAVNYFDIPLQHVAPSVLESMRRGGGPEEYLKLIDDIRAIIPDAAIRTTFLLGYPGETAKDFKLLLDFAEEARLDRVSCFAFSCQDTTPAAQLPDQVPPEVASERVEMLMEAQEAISLERNQRFEQQRLRVLLEDQDDRTGDWIGRSYRDAPEVDGQVLLTAEKATQTPEIGTFVWAIIEEALVHDLRGRIA